VQLFHKQEWQHCPNCKRIFRPAISQLGQFRHIERIGGVSALPLIATELLRHSEGRKWLQCQAAFI
jgi:hypothetical protein